MGEYFISSDGELYHYGVKGMKWGIRKDKKRLANSLKGKIGKPYPKHGVRETAEMLKIKSKRNLSDEIAGWSEKEDGRIRDDLTYGRITRQQADRQWEKLARDTDRKLALSKRAEKYANMMRSGYHYVSTHAMDTMDAARLHAQLHQQQVDLFMHQNHINIATNNTMWNAGPMFY